MIADVLARIEQRLAALGLSASAASIAAGLNREAIRNIRRAAQKNPTAERLGAHPRTLAALAEVLQTTPGWLLTGRDEPTEQPAGSATGASSLPYVDWDKAAEYLDENRSLEGVARLGERAWPRGTFVTRVADEAMNRLAPAGSYIVVDRTERLVSAGLIYLGVIGDQVVFRRWLPNPERAEPFSTDPSFETKFLGAGRRWDIIGRVRRIFLDV